MKQRLFQECYPKSIRKRNKRNWRNRQKYRENGKENKSWNQDKM